MEKNSQNIVGYISLVWDKEVHLLMFPNVTHSRLQCWQERVLQKWLTEKTDRMSVTWQVLILSRGDKKRYFLTSPSKSILIPQASVISFCYSLGYPYTMQFLKRADELHCSSPTRLALPYFANFFFFKLTVKGSCAARSWSLPNEAALRPMKLCQLRDPTIVQLPARREKNLN